MSRLREQAERDYEDRMGDLEAADRRFIEREDWLRRECEKAAADTTEPATCLMALVIDEGLPFGQAQAAYQRRFGASANLQDAAEREAA